MILLSSCPMANANYRYSFTEVYITSEKSDVYLVDQLQHCIHGSLIGGEAFVPHVAC